MLISIDIVMVFSRDSWKCGDSKVAAKKKIEKKIAG